jgi:hypothetical protein
MFSEDPPILRNTAIAAVLLASIGFAAYSYFFAPTEIPEELQDYRIALESNQNALSERLATQVWQSADWHDQVFTSLSRMKVAQQGLTNDWSEEVGEQELASNTELIEVKEQEIIEAYLAEIT